MLRFLRLLRLSFWRAFAHDAFATSKASAYSSILTFFPVLVIVGSVLANWRKGAPYLREISYALGSILPAGSNTALNYLKGAPKHPIGFLLTTAVITLWTASGVMISWMDGFRRCYELPKTWGLVKERLVAFLLVIFALTPMAFATTLVAVGSKFEIRLLPYLDPDFSFYILLMWGAIRWVIATLTSISVIALIYHHAVPRTQPWHSVIPGAILATILWFSVTVGFRAYLQHFGDFTTIYGSLGAGMALLVWMYMISLVVLVGAEFNALLFPRAMLGKELTAINSTKP
ncbi:MAG TPA: YihY/virulence factor BrkB family protein [Terriglobia bacterium]|nr:YihY/virulence factor BrkB family protein [Terriglobia bacterium]HEV3510051.1 YihY/virulence factor BrkB family protein [Candidatus Sulfotelmatobacter sp.]